MNHQLFHHLHQQKKLISLRKPLFPDKWLKILDKVAFIVGILGPICTLPQLYTIWILHEASGVSIFSWASYALFNIVLLFYGIAHQVKLMMVMYTLWFIVNFAVAFGAFLYN